MESFEPVDRHREEVEKETNATVKLVLFELERLAREEPRVAQEPVEFNRRRKAVIRKIWNLVKEAMAFGKRAGRAEAEAELSMRPKECPNCGYDL